MSLSTMESEVNDKLDVAAFDAAISEQIEQHNDQQPDIPTSSPVHVGEDENVDYTQISNAGGTNNVVEEDLVGSSHVPINNSKPVLESLITDGDVDKAEDVDTEATSPSFKTRENLFDRVKHESLSENPPIVEPDKPVEPVEQVQDYETSQPEVTPAKSPMVVSVGTIEVNGVHEYEDINIMSKGSSSTTTAAAAPPLVPETSSENSQKDDYESFRDLRFSSVSMYDKPHFEEDIEIKVEDAQKHAAESFVSYKVITKTTRESFQQHEFHVRRRYQDFLWLSNVLLLQYPSHIIPPMPQKKVFNRYDPSFLRLRQLALNKFLKRIAEHPILSTSEHFFTFLSAKQVELTEQKKTTITKKFPNIQIPVKVTESPFKKTSEYLDQFSKTLNVLATHSSKLHKDQLEQAQIMKTISPSAALWANVEGDLEPILTKFGEITNTNTELLEHLVESKEEIFNESIKEYQLYISLVKNVLKHRDQMHITRDFYTETILSKQKDLEKLEASEPGKSIATFFGKSKEQVKEEKVAKLKQEISSLSTDGEVAADELVVANANIRSDVERWKINKENDCRVLISSVADAHIKYFEESAANWESLMTFIDNVDSF